MNHRIINHQDLLDKNGHLNEPGYATKEIFNYNRNMIKASKWRIKEWDYYCAISSDYAFSFTIADLGYMALISGSLLDFKTGKEIKNLKLKAFTFGKLGLPTSTNKGDLDYKDKDRHFQFLNKDSSREILIDIHNFVDGKNLKANLHFKKHPKDDLMLIATPFPKRPTRFYYNQKINCMNVSGQVTIGQETYEFNPSKDFGVLDWGRGVWTYKNTWYWSSLSGLDSKGNRIGLNLGYGFGDTSKATENIIFYNGVAHKLDDVTFKFDENDYLKAWTIEDNNNRLQLTMTPILDRKDHTNLIIIKNMGHQVFGKFNGSVVLDSGEKVQIIDQIGFAEVITNHY
jgi:hypothetical protein